MVIKVPDSENVKDVLNKPKPQNDPTQSDKDDKKALALKKRPRLHLSGTSHRGTGAPEDFLVDLGVAQTSSKAVPQPI